MGRSRKGPALEGATSVGAAEGPGAADGGQRGKADLLRFGFLGPIHPLEAQDRRGELRYGPKCRYVFKDLTLSGTGGARWRAGRSEPVQHQRNQPLRPCSGSRASLWKVLRALGGSVTHGVPAGGRPQPGLAALTAGPPRVRLGMWPSPAQPGPQTRGGAAPAVRILLSYLRIPSHPA